MHADKKDQIYALLKGIETGDPESVRVVNEAKYIQHNPLTKEGSVGLAELFKRLSKTSPVVSMHRVFEDGDFVFAHMTYKFSSTKIAFEVFRFEDGQAVEHWDNIQPEKSTNASGHDMVDGTAAVADSSSTECSRALIQSYTDTILINRELDSVDTFVSENLIQHNPQLEDGIGPLRLYLENKEDSHYTCRYQALHRVLADKNFVLTMSEGMLNQRHVSIFDLYRIDNNKIVEHWDTVEEIPPKQDWKNDNGKF